MRAITIPAHAKVNLRLHVVGRRADGYHELRTIFQSISLHDTLQMELTRGRGIELEVIQHPHTNVIPSPPKAGEGPAFRGSQQACPSGKGNLVWRAMEALRRELKMKQGVRVRLTKRIPIGAGLGGGSSDAAAALLGMLRLTGSGVGATRRVARGRATGSPLPMPRLLEIASSIGADVPFFLLGGRALGVGRGDEIYPLPDLPRRETLLIVAPRDIAVDTKQAYGWLAAWLTKRRASPKISSFCALCWSPQELSLVNDFEAVVFQRHPRLARIKRELLRRGAQEAALAGSGSAVFGVYRHPAQARRTAQSFPDDRTFVVETLSREKYRKALGLREL